MAERLRLIGKEVLASCPDMANDGCTHIALREEHLNMLGKFA